MAKSKTKTGSKSIDPNEIYNKFKKMTIAPTERKYVKTGCEVLDDLFSKGKGIPLGTFIEFTSQSGIGKCVTGDTIVCVNNTFKKISEGITCDGFTEETGSILSEPSKYLQDSQDTYSHKYREFVDTIITLNDVHGNSISCTPEHPLLVIDSDKKCKWIKAKDIQLGDCILMRNTTAFNELTFNSKKYIEGYALDHTIENNNGENFVYVVENDVSSFRWVLEKANYINKEESNIDTNKYYNEFTHEKLNKETRYYYKINGIQLKKSFYEPMTLNELLNKVCGMFDNNNAIVRDECISFLFSSEENCIDFQRMMAMLGFLGHRSRIQSYKFTDCLKFNKTSSYYLAETLVNLTKTRKLELLSLIGQVKRYFERQHSQKEFFDSNNEGVTNTCIVSEKKIISDKQFVYDYTIPKSHKFIANGFVSHNTTIMLDVAKHLIEDGKKVLYIDAECGVNEDILESTGLIDAYNNDRFMHFSLNSFNDCGELLDAAVVDPEVTLIVIDSITALTPDELTDTDKKISDGQIGIHSRYTGNLLQRYKNKINKNEKTIVFINQMRTKIPTGYGIARDEPAGGNAQRFSMDIRLMMKKIEYKYDENDKDKETPIGSTNDIWAIKNRFVLPNVHYRIKLLYGKGIDEVNDCEKWLIDNGIVEPKNAGVFLINWNGEQIKIRGQANYSNWVKEHIDEIKTFIENASSGYFLDAEEDEEEFDDESLSELENGLET